MIRQTSILLLLLSVFFVTACTSSKSSAVKKQEQASDELRRNMEFLASDSLKGRFPGTPESQVAASFIRKKLSSYGYKPLASDGIQTFGLTMPQKLAPGNSLSIGGKAMQLGQDFTTLSISSDSRLSAGVVFAGYGLSVTDKGLERNDYDSLDVRGKWAMVLMGEPSDKYTPYSRYQAKAVTAREKGAAGILLVAQDDAELMPFMLREATVGIPCLQISRNTANRLLQGRNTTLQLLEKSLQTTQSRKGFDLNIELTAQTDIENLQINTGNVVMILEGKNPALNGESIVIGAHYDHLGFGGPGSGSRRPAAREIHNGADDNSSGVTLMLQLAKQLAGQGKELERSIVVVAFGAEEQGIVGSKYFVDHLPKEAGKVVCMLNFDMVGRLNADKMLQVNGTGTFAEAEGLVKGAANPDSLRLRLSKGGFGPSDHAAFYARQIPVLYFTTGVHTDYHTPDDDPDKINYNGMYVICNFADDIVKKLASMPQAPVYRNAGDSEMVGGHGRAFKVTLGIIPDFTSSGRDGMRADVVSEGKPAYKAGMQAGDMIVAINKKKVGNIQDYMVRLSELKAGEIAEVEVKRGDATVVLYVEL